VNPRRRTAVVLDPYPLWADAVDQVLARAGVTAVARAFRPADALALVEQLDPDGLVGEIHGLDAELDGPAVLEAALRIRPRLRTIVVSGSQNPEDVQRALDAGASAYVFKTAGAAELLHTARRIFDEPGAGAAVTDGEPGRGLTKRELEILRLVAEGHSNAQLARMLWVTEQTVKFHLSNIYRKLDVANRTEASRWAQVHDLLPGPGNAVHVQ
jgi:two-component system, NarL family, response regulator LiaR